MRRPTAILETSIRMAAGCLKSPDRTGGSLLYLYIHCLQRWWEAMIREWHLLTTNYPAAWGAGTRFFGDRLNPRGSRCGNNGAARCERNSLARRLLKRCGRNSCSNHLALHPLWHRSSDVTNKEQELEQATHTKNWQLKVLREGGERRVKPCLEGKEKETEWNKGWLWTLLLPPTFSIPTHRLPFQW